MNTKLLLVEDDVALAKALKIRLESMGYSLITAADIASAMSMMIHRKPDVSLIDINLPDGTGFTLAKQILNNPNTQNIPVVFTSASNNSDYRDMVKHFSSVPLLEKPFDATQLVVALEFTRSTDESLLHSVRR